MSPKQPKMAGGEHEWLTVPEVAELIQVNPATVRAWIAQDRLPAVRAVGRRWRINRNDLQQMLDHLREPSSG